MSDLGDLSDSILSLGSSDSEASFDDSDNEQTMDSFLKLWQSRPQPPKKNLSVFQLSDAFLDRIGLKYFNSYAVEMPPPEGLVMPELAEIETSFDLEELKAQVAETWQQEPNENSTERALRLEEEDVEWYGKIAPPVQECADGEYDENDPDVSFLNTLSPYIYLEGGLEDICMVQAIGQRWERGYTMSKGLFDRHEIENPVAALRQFKVDAAKDISAMLFVGGGQFSAAVFSHVSLEPEEVRVVASKTVNAADSEVLAGEIVLTVEAWKPYLQHCKSIYVRAKTIANNELLLNTLLDRAEVTRTDPRVRPIPFPTLMASMEGLRLAWLALTQLKILPLPEVDITLQQDLDRHNRLNRARNAAKAKASAKANAQLILGEGNGYL